MTCQFRDSPPDESPCYCTATYRVASRQLVGSRGAGYTVELSVCEHHAGVLRDQGAETWPIERN